MIKEVKNIKGRELNCISEIWLQSNIEAHNFISEQYWFDDKELVKTYYLKPVIFFVSY